MIEETLERIAVALETLASASTQAPLAPVEKQKTTKKKTAVKKEKPAEPEPETDFLQDAPVEPVITIEALNSQLVALAAKMGPTGVTEIMGLLKHYDVANVTGLPEDKRAELLEKAKEVAANAG